MIGNKYIILTKNLVNTLIVPKHFEDDSILSSFLLDAQVLLICCTANTMSCKGKSYCIYCTTATFIQSEKGFVIIL